MKKKYKILILAIISITCSILIGSSDYETVSIWDLLSSIDGLLGILMYSVIIFLIFWFLMWLLKSIYKIILRIIR